MKKEKLTLNNIKSDLKHQIKYSYDFIGAAAFGLAFSLFCSFGITTYEYISSDGIIVTLCAPLLSILSLSLLIYWIIYITRIYIALRNTENIVKDKLVGTKIREYGRGRTDYLLHFSSYGKYIIPDENYKWSSMYNMRDNWVYRYSECGDEFYLVLSKKHTGKILLAYNTKLFDLK